MADNRYCTDYARLGTSKCKKCKQGIDKKALRLGKLVSNPFSEDGGDMKQWYHPHCIFETFLRARATTKVIESASDIEGFKDLEKEGKDEISRLIKAFEKEKEKKGTPKKKQAKLPFTSPKKDGVALDVKTSAKPSDFDADTDEEPNEKPKITEALCKDDTFREFRRLCGDIAEEASYNGKTEIVRNFLNKGSSGDGFKGDLYIWVRSLLPGFVKRVYNLKDKQLAKIFTKILHVPEEEMLEDLEQGDAAETVKTFYERSTRCPPLKKSVIGLAEVDSSLERLAGLTKEDEQRAALTSITKRCTANDLKMIVRLIKRDLRINAGAKHILDALDKNAYEAFQASRDLRDVIDRLQARRAETAGKPGLPKALSIKASLMTPVLPMLAEACKSVDYAFKKCPNKMFAEIKYDGERVQVHKRGSSFSYFSRSLKPVVPHKVQHFEKYIPEAFPGGADLILDSEVLLVDRDGRILPFGTLGKHKKEKFSDANVCLFIFDCLHLNGESLMHLPMVKRRQMLEENMTEVKNRIMFSEKHDVTERVQLQALLTRVFREGLEGLVLKDKKSIYEPGKRHWLKVKKDYLEDGAMADSADLVVLGAYFGTGTKGGIMSVFLMGCLDASSGKWCTVTKVGNGLDDKTLAGLQKTLQMDKISKDSSKVPNWLKINKSLLPDFVVKDPKDAPVWEITGAEFSDSDSHTAGGVSIRFPRVTKMRDDKSWKEATNLVRLKELYKVSKEHSDIPDMVKGGAARKEVPMDVDEPSISPKESPSPSKKRKSKDSDLDEADESPKKKIKPECKYGEACYQTNAVHKEKFSHPKAAGPKIKRFEDLFTALKIYVPNSLALSVDLKRYVVAYNGDVATDPDDDSVDMILVKDASECVSGRHVTVEWLTDSIKQKKRLPLGSYQK